MRSATVWAKCACDLLVLPSSRGCSSEFYINRRGTAQASPSSLGGVRRVHSTVSNSKSDSCSPKPTRIGAIRRITNQKTVGPSQGKPRLNTSSHRDTDSRLLWPQHGHRHIVRTGLGCCSTTTFMSFGRCVKESGGIRRLVLAHAQTSRSVLSSGESNYYPHSPPSVCSLASGRSNIP